MTHDIRVAAGSIREATDEILTFVAQMGCSGVILNTPALTGQTPFGSSRIGSTYWNKPEEEGLPSKWDYLELLQLRTRIESYGLRLEAIENVPLYFYQKCILGLPGRDQEIENYQETIRHLGRAGHPHPRLSLDGQQCLADLQERADQGRGQNPPSTTMP